MSGDNEKILLVSEMSGETCSSINKTTPTRDSYWFAHGGAEESLLANSQAVSRTSGDLKDLQLQKEREERIRIFREQQEDERVKRLKELEQSFVQAKKYREQQEEERRRKIEEARVREIERRQQVEERKRQIWEAEQERKEAILRRNMEREARIEARRNAQRNSQYFAFGSSTPRTFDLDLAAIGVGRNVSQGSVLMSSVSRKSEERDLGPPRATSACSLDRKFENGITYDNIYSNDYRSTSCEPTPARVNLCKQIAMHHKSSDDMKACLSMWDTNHYRNVDFFDSPSSGWLIGSGVLVGEDCMSRSMVSLSSSAFRGRRRTDIMPTPGRERSVTPHVTPRGKDTSRSPSRPHSSMSGASEMSTTSSAVSAVNMRPKTAPRRPRPFSYAGVSVDHAPAPIPPKRDPERQPRLPEKNVSSSSKALRAKSTGREKETTENAKPSSAPKKPVPPPKSSEVLAKAKTHLVATKDNLRKVPKTTVTAKQNKDANPSGNVILQESKSPITKAEPGVKDLAETTHESKGSLSSNVTAEEVIICNVHRLSTDTEHDVDPEDSKPNEMTESSANACIETAIQSESKLEETENTPMPDLITITALNNKIHKSSENQESVPSSTLQKEELQVKEIAPEIPCVEVQANNVGDPENISKDLTPSKPRITSEEEAKAALAEKRRLAREQAEREAEIERQRQEEIRRQEEEKKRLEELEQKRMEEEQIRLAELHRQLEEEKLQKAIEEREQREREENQRREEEARLKTEKEEQERKAREEAEKQRIELEERLQKEEEERAERKRRVEQIMARTRGKSTQSSASNKSGSTNNVEIASKANSQPGDPQSIRIVNGSHDTKEEKNPAFNSATESKVFNSNSWSISMSQSGPLPDLLHSETVKNGQSDNELFSNLSNSLTSSRTLCANDLTSPTQTNGYSSHEEMSCTTSPEEVSDPGLLINIGNGQPFNTKTPEAADFTKLVDCTAPSTLRIDNYLINVDDVNSNVVNSENPFFEFGDNLQKKQETAVTDLLS